MFCLIYLDSGKYGVVDKAKRHFHLLSEDAFKALVSSAEEMEVCVEGVEKTREGYSYYPVALEEFPNIFNALPYIEKVNDLDLSPSTLSTEYNATCSNLVRLSSAISSVSTDRLCLELAKFAYLHLVVPSVYRLNNSFVVALLDILCGNYPSIHNVLCKEPFPEDVMKKFRFKPISSVEG